MNPTPDLAALVDRDRMRKFVEHLAAFNTRNTNTPELTEAAEWVQSQYAALPGFKTELFKYVLPKSRRAPEDKEVVEVVARKAGSSGRAILIGGHIDTINLSADIFTGRAPGANDDASGSAVALEVARIMSTLTTKQDLIHVAFSGEEQGLNGSKALAAHARKESWKLDAVLSNDMVGNSSNDNGQKDTHHVRVFSDEGNDKLPNYSSRELARFAEWITRGRVKEFGIKLVLRADRFGRGGDHTPFHNEGFPAIRLVEVHEEYTRQHTPDDLPEHVDWNYLANACRINLLTFASLAQADVAPSHVVIKRDQSHDTTLTWEATPGVCYAVYWRDTACATWQDCEHVGAVDHVTIKKVNKDDYFFAVGAEGGVPVAAV